VEHLLRRADLACRRGTRAFSRYTYPSPFGEDELRSGKADVERQDRFGSAYCHSAARIFAEPIVLNDARQALAVPHVQSARAAAGTEMRSSWHQHLRQTAALQQEFKRDPTPPTAAGA
jgi:hypothetical protein